MTSLGLPMYEPAVRTTPKPRLTMSVSLRPTTIRTLTTAAPVSLASAGSAAA